MKITLNNLDTPLDTRLYVVSWHLGGTSLSDEPVDNYCEECGDFDLSDSGSSAYGELLSAVVYEYTYGNIDWIDRDGYNRVKELLKENDYDLKISLKDVKRILMEDTDGR